MHHFFVTPKDVDETINKIFISGSDVNHIKNVLRMKQGEKILISDGNGKDYICCLDCYNGTEEAVAEIIETGCEGTELSSKIYLFQGLPKSDKMEFIIQKAVELGVHEIIPFSAKRTIVKLDKKKEEAKLKRWNEIAKSAAKQSRRSIIPLIREVMTFNEAIKYAKTLDINLIPYENYKDMSETKRVIDKIESGMSIGIFIGPEGGFDEEEIKAAIENQMERISLGRRILRTETAGLMIISVLMFRLEE